MPVTLAKPERIMRQFRVIKEDGKPVGPHVDFKYDREGNIEKDPVSGKYVEEAYLPGDLLWSPHDLTELNGRGNGVASKKFEHVYSGPSDVAPRDPATKSEPAKPVPAGLKVDLKTLENMKYGELMALVGREKIDLQGATKKEDLIKVILKTFGGEV